MKRTIFICLFAICSFGGRNAAAQSEALPFVRIPHNPHSMAMGGAGVASVSSVAYSSYINAAAIPYGDSTMDISAGYLGWMFSGAPTNMASVAGAYNIGSQFGVAAGFTYGMGQKYETTNGSGTAGVYFFPSEIQANIGLSWRFLPYLSFGANLKYLNSSLAEGQSYGAFASDIFLMSRLADFSVALGVSSLGSKVTSLSGAKFSLPASATIGLGYEKEFAEKHGLEVLADADYYFSGAFTVATGASYAFDDMISVRGGYHYGGKSVIPSYASVGLGVKFFGVRIDASYLFGSKIIKNSFGVSLGYSF